MDTAPDQPPTEATPDGESAVDPDELSGGDSSAAAVDDAEVAELRSILVNLQTTVATLVDRSGTVTSDAGTGSAEAEGEQVSRIIRMANLTAEAAIADARAEAAAIVEAASRESAEVVRAARELAAEELAAERTRLASAVSAWVSKRTELIDQLDSLGTVFSDYSAGLGEVGATITSAVGQLESDAADDRGSDQRAAGTAAPEPPNPSAPPLGHQAHSRVTVIDLTDSTSPDQVASSLSALQDSVVDGDRQTPDQLGNGVPAAPTPPAATARGAAPRPLAISPADRNAKMRPGLFGR